MLPWWLIAKNINHKFQCISRNTLMIKALTATNNWSKS